MVSVFGLLGCSWAWSCIWAWWWLRVRKIFAYEVIEIARQDSVAIKLYERPIRYMRWNNKPPTEHKTQTIAKIIYVRLKVTISLYLNPNNIGSVKGWLTRPTNRSVVARQRYKSLDGGWREDSLRRATRMRQLPRIPVMERRMLTAENEMDCCSNSPIQTGEHCQPLKKIRLWTTSCYIRCFHHCCFHSFASYP